jgi:hypothetical protein
MLLIAKLSFLPVRGDHCLRVPSWVPYEPGLNKSLLFWRPTAPMRVSSEAVRGRGLGSGEPMIIIKQESSFRQSVRNLPGPTELGGDGQLSQTRTRDVIQRLESV